MIGFANAEDEVYSANATLAARWLVPLALALLVHCVPMFCLTLSGAPGLPDDFTIAVDFTDSGTEQPEAASATEAGIKPPAALSAPIGPPRAAATEKTPAAPAIPAPPNLAQASPPMSAPSQPQEKPKLKLLDLEPLIPAPGVAFDESKSTKEAPKEGYLSDRTSTAADRGPKNLPRGDPFMDKGESKVIRYQERRGEGNLPSLAPDDMSGSVKKEGNPDAGHGTQDARPPDAQPPLKAQLPPPSPEKKVAEQQTRIVAPDPRPTVPKGPEEKARLAAARTEESELEPDGIGGLRPKPPVAKVEPRDFIQRPPDSRALTTAKEEHGTASPATARTDPARQDPPDELKAFAALLDGKGRADGRGGNVGGKVGVHARPGEKGHEGDGSLRPGHDEAVSDVTTINLESSAAEFDEARFAKIYDPKTAYVKPLARRIDGKWKAERVARARWRPVPGVVTFKIVMRKDGKLLSATEAGRTPKDLPDEYSASAKIAIERAADPLSEPFPPALSEHDTLEFTFNFLY